LNLSYPKAKGLFGPFQTFLVLFKPFWYATCKRIKPQTKKTTQKKLFRKTREEKPFYLHIAKTSIAIHKNSYKRLNPDLFLDKRRPKYSQVLLFL
jgi:hypothetical protein